MIACARLVLVALLLCCLAHTAIALFRGPPPVLQPRSADYVAPLPANTTAYVAIHTHTHTHRDRYQLDGILTMYQTLRDTGPDSDRALLVAVTPNTPAYVRQQYQSHSLTVVELPPSQPSTVCDDRFNRVHLWSRGTFPYDRLVFIDSDVLVIHGIDVLFQCSAFCIVYSSIQHFTDSLMVVEPNNAVYQKMLDLYRALTIHRWLHVPRSHCAEESWHYFLYAFGDIESAPLFEPHRGQHAGPVHRLSSSMSLNAMMYYEFFTWRLMRGKEFRNYSDSDGIPSYSLSFTGLKPYNFAPGIFFNLNWLWHRERDRALNKNYTMFLIGWTLFALVLVWLYQWGIRLYVQSVMRERKKGERLYGVINTVRLAMIAVFGYSCADVYRRTDVINRSLSPISVSASSSGSTSSSNQSRCSLFYYWLPMIGLTPLCLVLAFAFINVNGWFLYYTIDVLTPPHLAWTVFVACHLLMTACDLQFVRWAVHFAPQRFACGSHRKTVTNANTEAEDEVHSLLENDKNEPAQPASLSSRQSYPPFHFAAQCQSVPVIHLSLTDCLSITFWESFTFLSMRWKKYPEFVVKMFAIFPLVAGVLLAHVNLWRHCLGQVERQIEPNANTSVSNSSRK